MGVRPCTYKYTQILLEKSIYIYGVQVLFALDLVAPLSQSIVVDGTSTTLSIRRIGSREILFVERQVLLQGWWCQSIESGQRVIQALVTIQDKEGGRPGDNPRGNEGGRGVLGGFYNLVPPLQLHNFKPKKSEISAYSAFGRLWLLASCAPAAPWCVPRPRRRVATLRWVVWWMERGFERRV